MMEFIQILDFCCPISVCTQLGWLLLREQHLAEEAVINLANKSFETSTRTVGSERRLLYLSSTYAKHFNTRCIKKAKDRQHIRRVWIPKHWLIFLKIGKLDRMS